MPEPTRQGDPAADPQAAPTDYEIGQDNVEMFGMDVHHPVFFASALMVLAFVLGTLFLPELASRTMLGARAFAIDHFDWLFMLAGNLVVLVCLALIASPLGRIRLSGSAAEPEFSTLSWFAMLFAAGMGIGLMFWSVAEPVAYYTDWAGTPLGVAARSERAAELAMSATLFHWSLHPWAIYGVVGLSLAFFTFNRGLPLTIRSVFYPVLGDRCWGLPGHLIDLVAVLATLFGLATSLGLGAKQAAAGLAYLFGIDSGIATQVGIIVGVTSVAVISVVRGLEGGVRVLSNANMTIAALLLAFVFIAGPTAEIAAGIFGTAVSYVQDAPRLSVWFGRDDQDWYHGWTVFYWAWWISWSPFVGMFIARVSRGRTVREFLCAVLLIPSLVTLVWMSTFGISALEQVQAGVGELAGGLSSAPVAMFQMLDNLPLSQITSLLGITLVLVFFITSSDSGSLVIDSITAGGKLDAPVPQRIFWATLEGVVAGTLLFGGGAEALRALQAGAISVGLPFVFVLLVMCYSLYVGLLGEHRRLRLLDLVPALRPKR
jgi:BCCT family betaine/carnitine transporter